MSETVTAHSILRRRGSTFALAAGLLPQPQAVHVARLYAACRAIDDLADEVDPALGGPRLAAIRQELAQGQPHDPIARDIVALAAESAFDLGTSVELVDGVRGDLGPVSLADTDELLRYAYAVAGTVGCMMADLLGARSTDARQYAVDLGIAMQLTNIARDVLEDARRGRRYLPGSWAPFTPEEIATAAVAVRPRCALAILRVLALADRFYDRGLLGLCYLPLRQRLAISVAAAVYREIGTLIRQRQAPYWEGRVSVPPARRLAVAAAAGLRALRTPVVWPASSGTSPGSFDHARA